jgi:pimeloyl-ACP methyl ester carboxylesterase
MPERVVTSEDGAELCLETFGDPGDPAVLLIAGMAASMDYWDAELCGRLAAGGRHVIRYDHRDTGRSSSSPPGRPTYLAEDLTIDPLRILDGLGLARAHLAGVSMGGGIAQELAAHHADRVATVTLIATSPAGSRDDGRPLPPPVPRVAATFEEPLPEPDWTDRDAVVTYLVETARPYAGGLGFDEQRERRVAAAMVDRTRDMRSATTNHPLAGGESKPFHLADIRVPTLVMHGTDDPMFPFPHGEALAAEIPGATLVALDRMGHEFPPPPTWDVVVPALVRHTAG